MLPPCAELRCQRCALSSAIAPSPVAHRHLGPHRGLDCAVGQPDRGQCARQSHAHAQTLTPSPCSLSARTHACCLGPWACIRCAAGAAAGLPDACPVLRDARVLQISIFIQGGLGVQVRMLAALGSRAGSKCLQQPQQQSTAGDVWTLARCWQPDIASSAGQAGSPQVSAAGLAAAPPGRCCQPEIASRAAVPGWGLPLAQTAGS